MKKLVEVRFFGQEMWIMDSGRSDELLIKVAYKRVYNKFDFSKKLLYIQASIWYNDSCNIIPFFSANRRVEANGCHYLITNFGNC